MKKAPSQSRHLNKVERTIFNASLEVLGQDCISPVFKQADLSYLIEGHPVKPPIQDFDLSELGRIQTALEDAYGPYSGRGLALRTGRALFKHILREFKPSADITNLQFRLLPLDEKLRVGSEFIAQVLSTQLNEKVHVQEAEGQIRWIVQDCPLCRGRKTQTPGCHLFVGFLQEAYYWISGGKQHQIEETDCIAQGDDACIWTLYSPALK